MRPIVELLDGMDSEMKGFVLLMAVVMLTSAGIGLVAMIGESATKIAEINAEQETRRLAIESGAADIVPDEYGNPTFRWREVQDETE